MTIINRPIYTSRLLKYVDKSLIKVLTGQRRVGKSCILKYVAEEIRRNVPGVNIIHINLEDFAFSHITNAQLLHNEVTSKMTNEKKNYIFIDEVQEVDNFDKVLRSLILDENCDVYVTGSNSAMLSSEIVSRLGGRSIEVRVHPLSFNEFLEFHSFGSDYQSLMLYLQYGGLPYLSNLPEHSTWDEYLEGIVNSIIFKDIVARHSLRNSAYLEKLLLFLASNIGNIFSAKKISDYLKSQRTDLSVGAIQNYMSYAREAFIVNQCCRWDIKGKKYFELGEKYYFEDLGIRNRMVGFRPGDMGALIENAVYNHLIIQGYSVKTGQLSKGNEIDFIAEKCGEVKYLQVSLTVNQESTREREFGNLEKISDNYEKIVVTLNDRFPNTCNGIKTVTLLEFLSSFR